MPKKSDLTMTQVEDDFKNMMSLLFKNVTEQEFIFVIDDSESFSFKYTHIVKSDKILYLKVETDYSEMVSAKALNDVVEKISNGKHRKDYNVIRAYDETSNVYCSKLMPLFGEFERRMRELLYVTLVKAFGNEWFQKSFDEKLSSDIKGRSDVNKNKLIENALDELTYEQLKQLLFDPFTLYNFSDLLESELSEENLKSLEKEDIVKIINNCRKRSMWERFFAYNKNLITMPDDINYLQKYRNRVMHNKNINYYEFIEVCKRLNIVNTNLTNSIYLMETKIYKADVLNDDDFIVEGLLAYVLGVITPEMEEELMLSLEERNNKIFDDFLNSILNYKKRRDSEVLDDENN